MSTMIASKCANCQVQKILSKLAKSEKLLFITILIVVQKFKTISQ